MGKKHKKHKSEWRTVDDYVNKPLEKPLKLVLKVGGSEVTELSGSGHDSSYYDDRSDHERERHKEKKKKKKKKSEKEKDKHVGDEERRRRKEEKKRKREREQCDTEGEVEGANAVKKMEEEKKRKQFDAEGEVDDFDRGIKVEQVEHPADRPVRSCRTQQENDCTPIQQLLEHFLRQLQRKDPHGFFAFPVTDAIAPGYSMIIKHPMDFGTIKDKIEINDYKSVTEFKADFKLMCDNAMVYNRPETVYYKAAKKLLHTGFKMMSKERLLALKRSMSFMQNMDFSQQAAILGNEDTVTEEPVPEVIPVPVEPTKKSKKPVKDMNEVISYLYEPEGTACSLTDSTAEEHVLALVEHAADEARDRIHRHLPTSKLSNMWLLISSSIQQDTHRTPNKMQLIKRKIGYLKKDADGALVYTVVNQSDPETEEEETHPVDLSSLSNKLLPGLTTLGFKDDRRNRVTYLNSAYNTQSLQNNTVFPDLRPDEMELLYSAYGDDTGVQCALSLQEFVKGCGNFTKTIVDGLLDQMTGGDHSKAVYQIRQRRNIGMKPPDETKTNLYDMQVGDAAGMAGDSNSSVLDFMSMKSYSDMSLDMSMLNTLGKTVKKEPDHEDGHLHFDDATKLLQDLHEAQNDRVGSRPSSNLSSLSNASERDQHHLESPAHLSVGEQAEMVHDPYEFLQSPEPGSTANS
ncbi:bromodomain-containing protein 9-like isoform X2 [Acipenser ruthenus]|uniref:bromodomain-containing protein 9-like isoform X2 n=1 Tax=Acipenser ruthenus TaxID=7906 RepID=UPI002741801C|nr:bromodomain-containing protein 9-like isoform X2 [Acipenser ruthenus]